MMACVHICKFSGVIGCMSHGVQVTWGVGAGHMGACHMGAGHMVTWGASTTLYTANFQHW